VSTRVLTMAVSVILAGCSSIPRPPAQEEDHSHHMGAATPSRSDEPAQGQSQGISGIPASNATAPARLAASPRHGEWVPVAYEPGSADSLMTFIVYPASRTKAPVVVVIHDNQGMSAWARAVGDQLAADGFIAIVPDLLSRARGGASTTDLAPDSARRLSGAVSAADRNRGIAAAASYAMMQPSAEPRYAVIGFCWGGGTTFMHAVQGGVKGFSGGVSFYGGFPYQNRGQEATATTAATPATIMGDSVAKIRVPLMLLNGSKDMRIGAMMPALDSTMKANGKTYAGTNYDGAIHGFLRAQDDGRATRNNESEDVVTAERAANVAASKDAWPKTIAFLKKNLGAR
jgi:carboxymethylenebutenolidase